MPITKAAIKAAKQSVKRRAQRRPSSTQMKTMIRKLTDLVSAGKKDEAVKVLPQVYKSIDMAAKKRHIHPNNAARKKSLVARMVK